MAKKESSRQKSRKRILVSLLLGGILVVSAITYASMSAFSASSTFGGLGSAHDHAAFLIMIDGEPIDFSQVKYQVQSQYIHVENRIGTTIHKHASQVPVGEFLRSVGMQVTENCLVTDAGTSYCKTDDKDLRLFVDDLDLNPALINGYIIRDGDKFLLYYGDSSEESIQAAKAMLEGISIAAT